MRGKLFNLSALALRLICYLAITTLLAMAQQVQRNPIVIHERDHVITPFAFRDMIPLPWRSHGRVPKEHERFGIPHISSAPDALSQTTVLPEVAATISLNFDGITDSQGGGFVPPDTNASVGATQVVETVNLAYAVYDKTTGALEFGPTNIQTLYSPLGGECATGFMADPEVNYDRMAGRWVITIIAFNDTYTANDICIAVSTGSDATGAYNLYAFSYGNVLPDFPKVGVWPDAYYLTTDSFPKGGAFTGAETCALDRTNMLAGNAATAICFQRGASDHALLPADLDGATLPPAGAKNYQMDMASSTKLNLYGFHVDFVTPSNSTFALISRLTVSSFTDACALIFACVPQPSPGEYLDAIGDRLMYRLPYRNFGDHEALVANHSIKPSGSGKAVAGVRWYEIRGPDSSPVVFQSGTVGGGSSSVAKWMGSIAMDKNGDIALGYSKSSKSVKPSIEFVGRVPSDPLGAMESAMTIVNGGGVQQSSGNRWGDYSSMAIDLNDDCTFWYAQEYYKTSGQSNWTTRLASFKFTACR